MIVLVAATMLAPAPPNVLVIFSDDHARAAVSGYGSQIVKTPGVDRIIAEGIRFDRHYTSNPLCAPSRAMLLTGKYSHVNGHKDNTTSFDASQPNIAKTFQAHGYSTGAFGKWHLVSNPTGFDDWEVLPGQGAYFNPDFITPAGQHRENGYASSLITDKAIRWLEKSQQRPFFLYVGHKAPHRNFEPPLEKVGVDESKRYPEPRDLRTDYRTLNSGARKALMRIDLHLRRDIDLLVDYSSPRMTPEQRTRWEQASKAPDDAYRESLKTQDLMAANYQRYMRNYMKATEAMDDGIVRILDYLDKSGLAKNTIVVYASDQGFFLGEKGWYDKRWFYEPSAGTPLAIRVPGMKHQAVDSITGNVDVAPTLLDLAGIPVPSDMQGTSLKPLLGGKRLKRNAYGHFYESDDPDHKVPKYVAYVEDRYKVMYYYELDEWELFDLKRDPSESENVWSTDPKLAQVMRKKLAAKMHEVRDDPKLIAKVESD